MILSNSPRRQKGVLLVTFAIASVTLLMFAGLAVDVGFVYLTRATLAKGVDAASLTAVRHLSMGNAGAQNVATAVFDANQAGTIGEGRRATDEVLTFDFAVDDNGGVVTVDANVPIQTFFLRVIPQWETMTVAATATAGRVPTALGLALDRSGSMEDSGGDVAMPDSVTNFINAFADQVDQAAMSSYATTASMDVSMQRPFKSEIIDAVNDLDYEGWTFAHGSLDPVGAAVVAVPDPNENIFKTVIFFTDGRPNTFQDTFTCRYWSWWQWRWIEWEETLNVVPDNSDFFRNTDSGSDEWCPGVSEFTSVDGDTESLTENNVEDEGMLRVEFGASDLRNQDITIYAVGLGDNIDDDHLDRVANVADSDTYDPDQPSGLSLIAPNPEDLDQIFLDILEDIQARITG